MLVQWIICGFQLRISKRIPKHKLVVWKVGNYYFYLIVIVTFADCHRLSLLHHSHESQALIARRHLINFLIVITDQDISPRTPERH